MEEIFCSACKTKATVHADGSVVCSCDYVGDAETDIIPVSWNTTRENVCALQLAESELE